MKKALFLLLAATCLARAHAADFPVKAAQVPLPAPNPIYNWTGFYIGAIGSYNWDSAAMPNGGIPLMDAQGGMGGVTLGYDYQMGNVVVGVLGDASFGSVSGSMMNGTVMSETFNEKAFSTIRGRLGYVVGPVLLYGTGGVAISNVGQGENCPTGVTTTGSFCGPGKNSVGRVNAGAYNLLQTQTFVSATVGAGMEWMVAPHWTFKTEYLWTDFGNQNFNLGNAPSGVATGPRTVSFMENNVRVGVNYNFGWPR